MKQLLMLSFALFSAAQLFSQETLQELIIGTSDPPSVPKMYIKCGTDNGVIVFNTTISDLQFSIPDAPSRLKDVSYSADDNCYVLCVQPTDTTIGGYTGYIIEIKGKNYITQRYSASGIKPIQAQYFKINPKRHKPVNTKPQILIARFSNETAYAKGFFYDKENDPVGKQVVNILSTKLNSTNNFISTVAQTDNKDANQDDLLADCQKKEIDYLITGAVTEYGRKNESEKKMKYQIVDIGVNISLIDVSTEQTIYSEEAKGEARTDGKKTDYDTTLNDKAISDAISKLTENIVKLFNK